jgi:hypothetical protein
MTTDHIHKTKHLPCSSSGSCWSAAYNRMWHTSDCAVCSLEPRAWNHSYRDYVPALWELVYPLSLPLYALT